MNSGFVGWPVHAPTSSPIRVFRFGDTLAPATSTGPIHIPQFGTQLRIVWQVRSDGAGASDTLSMQFNGDTGTTYNHQIFSSTGSTGANAKTTGATSGVIGTTPASTAPAGSASIGLATIVGYTSSVFYKYYTAQTAETPTSVANDIEQTIRGGYWTNTQPITSLTLLLAATGKFIVGSSFAIYIDP